MSFEYWLDRMRRRFDDGTLLDEAAVAEASELWRAAQPASPGYPTQAEAARLAMAGEWLGWLHARRYAALPGEAGRLELARAIVYLTSAGSTAIPEPLRWLLGPGADLDQQSTTGNALMEQAARSGAPVLFQAAIIVHELTLADRGPTRAVRLSNLAIAYRARYLRGGNADDAELAVTVGEHAVGALGAGDPNAAIVLSNVGSAYLARYDHFGRLPDLDRAIQLGEFAVSATNPGDPNAGIYLTTLGVACSMRFEQSGNLADIDRSIEFGERAMALLAPDNPNHATALSNLGAAYRARFERTGGLSDVDRAVEIGRWAIAGNPDDPNRTAALSNLGVALHDRFERTGDLVDLNQAIGYHTEALAATPEDDPDRALRLSNLSTAHQARFERLGDTADLDRTIELQLRAVAASRDGHPKHATFLGNLGVAFQTRFERLGELADLNRAIEYKERAAATFPRGHPSRAWWLSSLGVAYLARFERTGHPSDVDRAIASGEQAVGEVPEDNPNRARYLSNVGVALQTRFEHTGNLADLELAIVHKEQSVAATPADDPSRANHLSNLGLAHVARFERVGEVASLDRAIDVANQAVAATPADHPDRALRLSNLGGAYQTRYQHLGGLADLDLAIVHKERSVAATPADHPLLAPHLSNLGVAYLSRFGRTDRKSDVDNAIQVIERSVAATPRDDPSRVLRLSNLSGAYRVRGTAADLDRAVDLGHQALAAANEPRYHATLGFAYRARWSLTNAHADLDRAIEHHRQAVARTPPDQPARAARLYQLGRCLQSRGDAGASEVAALAEQAIAATTGPPKDRIWACWVFGRMAHALGELYTARRALDAAVSLLPAAAVREISVADQEFRLAANLGLVGEAIAVHCALDDPVGAVEAGEQGRGILLAAQLDLRTGLDGLRSRHPALARRLHGVRQRLNAPDPVDADAVSARKRLWAEYDAVLAEIRAQGIPAALPPTWTELWRAVAHRTVVLVNASPRRCDAIVLTSGQPVLRPLPELRLADAEHYAAELHEATNDPSPLTGELRRQRVLTELLGWLWDTAVAPVLDLVAPRSRVWWLPIGVLGLLPLHAAGHSGRPGALEAVISSYTPTLRALARSDERPAASVRRQLTVALERTPGLANLPYTAAEAANLPADLPPLINERATVPQVRAALPAASWVHFACHASTNPDTPSAGGLHLTDGVLPIGEVGRLDLAGAELAYLSACSTGHAGRRHADESIHLASAFQLAGYRHVVASLWPLADRVAATAADRFYRHLTGPTAGDAALALHEVTRTLRADNPERPHLWAPLIHSGP